MITEIPTASEFKASGLNQLYLAWQIAIEAVQDHEAVDDSVDEADREFGVNRVLGQVATRTG